jgi:hypothetical protein
MEYAHATFLRRQLSGSEAGSRSLLVRSALFDQIDPLLVVHLQRICQGTVDALVHSIHVGTPVDEDLNHAAILQVEGGIQNRV